MTMAASKSSVETSIPEREIVSTRTLAASRERVFRAFSEPAQLARWWGPKGFTNTIHEFDLRAGGMWRLTMHGPGGANYANESRFVEIVPLERVVFQHLEPVHGFRMTMIFAEQAGRTTLTWRMLFDSAEEATKVRRFVVAANEENFDRLAAILETKDNGPGTRD
jgi:uncharacterized protein YndB with AHSA1/START domain